MIDPVIISAVIAAIAAVSAPAIAALIQARRSRAAGVTNAHVQAQGSEPVTPSGAIDGFDRLVRRLEGQVERLEAEQKASDERINRLERESRVDRDLRWLAVQHIRALYSWIKSNVPEDKRPPAPPDSLVSHVYPSKEDQ